MKILSHLVLSNSHSITVQNMLIILENWNACVFMTSAMNFNSGDFMRLERVSYLKIYAEALNHLSYLLSRTVCILTGRELI